MGVLIPLVISSLTKEDIQIILKRIYQFNCFLCLFMVIWILVMPSSWLSGRSKLHDDLLVKYSPPENLAPGALVLKYAGHTAVHLTHTLPGAVWAALAPFQLHRGFRQRHKMWHRRMGYVFAGAAVLIAVGIGLIVQRELVFVHFFPDLPPPPVDVTVLGIPGLTLYFGLTLVWALKSIIWDRNVRAHERWIIRHVGSGIWIAVQRLLLFGYSAYYTPPVAPTIQRRAFSEAATLAPIITITLSEAVLQMMDRIEEMDRKSI